MISDDTLREGLQAPGMAYKISEKMNIAKLLGNAGVNRALISYPSAHISEFNVSRNIIDKGYFKEVFSLGRTIKSDIDKIYETGSNISLHFPFKIDNIYDIYNSIKYASKFNRLLEVSIVDITKYSINELINISKNVEKNGADILQLPDTTGNATPNMIYKIVNEIKKNINISIEVHCHNDNGSAVANSISGIYAGASYVDSTVMGIGERNGIADVLSIAKILLNSGYNIKIDINKLKKAYDYIYNLIIKKIGNNFLFDNLPVYGKNVYIHTAGTHAAFPDTFYGNDFSFNVYTGKSMIKKILKINNIELNDENVLEIVNIVKNQSVETGKSLNVNDIVKIAGEFNDGN